MLGITTNWHLTPEAYMIFPFCLYNNNDNLHSTKIKMFKRLSLLIDLFKPKGGYESTDNTITSNNLRYLDILKKNTNFKHFTIIWLSTLMFTVQLISKYYFIYFQGKSLSQVLASFKSFSHSFSKCLLITGKGEKILYTSCSWIRETQWLLSWGQSPGNIRAQIHLHLLWGNVII